MQQFATKGSVPYAVLKNLLFDQFGGTYRKESYYATPDLKMPDTENFEIGIWGQRHLYFLQHYHRVTYINLLTSGNLNEYLTNWQIQGRPKIQTLDGIYGSEEYN